MYWGALFQSLGKTADLARGSEGSWGWGWCGTCCKTKQQNGIIAVLTLQPVFTLRLAPESEIHRQHKRQILEILLSYRVLYRCFMSWFCLLPGFNLVWSYKLAASGSFCLIEHVYVVYILLYTKACKYQYLICQKDRALILPCLQTASQGNQGCFVCQTKIEQCDVYAGGW